MCLFAVGLFSLAWPGAAPPYGEIIWRMMLCGAGFCLFQSPNNQTIITSAPRNRRGGAQMALMFNMFGDSGTPASLLLAGVFAASAALVSSRRMTQANPQQAVGK